MPNTMSRGDRDERPGDVLEMLRWEDDGGKNVGADYEWLKMTDRTQRSCKIPDSEITNSQLDYPAQ